MVKSIHIPFGFKASGLEMEPQEPEEIFREHEYKNGNTTIKTSAIFCPSCSNVREKDTRKGGFKDKWVVKKSDYKTDLEYVQDETGFYVKCKSCGFDLRSHDPNFDTYVSIIVREDGDGPPLPLLNINDPTYQQGFFIIDYTEYERIRSEGTKQSGNVLPTITIDEIRYVISWNNFLTKMRVIPNISVVGIPKTYFQSL